MIKAFEIYYWTLLLSASVCYGKFLSLSSATAWMEEWHLERVERKAESHGLTHTVDCLIGYGQAFQCVNKRRHSVHSSNLAQPPIWDKRKTEIQQEAGHVFYESPRSHLLCERSLELLVIFFFFWLSVFSECTPKSNNSHLFTQPAMLITPASTHLKRNAELLLMMHILGTSMTWAQFKKIDYKDFFGLWNHIHAMEITSPLGSFKLILTVF